MMGETNLKSYMADPRQQTRGERKMRKTMRTPASIHYAGKEEGGREGLSSFSASQNRLLLQCLSWGMLVVEHYSTVSQSTLQKLRCLPKKSTN